MDSKTSWVLCFDKKNNEILVGKRGDDSNNSGQWCFPGGHVDDGEKSKQAATRELFEEAEIKVDASSLIKIGKLLSENKIRKYYLIIGDKDSFAPKATEELVKFKWVNLEKLHKIDNPHSSVLRFVSNKDIMKALKKNIKNEVKDYSLDMIKQKSKKHR